MPYDYTSNSPLAKMPRKPSNKRASKQQINVAAKRTANQAAVLARKANRELTKPSKGNAVLITPRPIVTYPMPGDFTKPKKPRDRRVPPPNYRI